MICHACVSPEKKLGRRALGQGHPESRADGQGRAKAGARAGMGDADSNVPEGFFPQAKCALGPPAGPYVKGERNTYTRKFAHAEVFVDLRNRTNSRVTFAGCEYR